MAEALFREAAAEQRIHPVPLSHLSIEVARVTVEDFVAGPQRLRGWFHGIRPWLEAARRSVVGAAPRISTCVLVDDYFTRFGEPAQVVPAILDAAADAGVGVDYLARQDGLTGAAGVSLPDLVLGRMVPEPPPGTDGRRPPFIETGWLSNGMRSPGSPPTSAMVPPEAWRPPVQISADRHSIFLDIELWSYATDGRRDWSPALLTAIWQLLRLGVLRLHGEPVAQPVPCPDVLPADWKALPQVIQFAPQAAPFSAYRTISLLDLRLLQVQDAVRTILGQVALDPAVLSQMAERAALEGIALNPEVTSRTEFVCVRG